MIDRKTVIVTGLAALWSGLASGGATAQAIPEAASARPYVIVLAHRACWGAAPEVSVSAIRQCLVIGADQVEIDVRESKDGVLVLMHDETVDRTTNGSGRVADLTAQQIRSLRLKRGAGGPDANLTEEHVPTLDEGLVAARGKLLVNLHLKAAPETKVAASVRRLGMEGKVTTWVTSSSNDPKLLSSPLLGVVSIIPTINECGAGYPAPCWTQPISSLNTFASVRPAAFFLDYRQTHGFIRSVSDAKRPVGTRIFVETLNGVDALPQAQRHEEWGKLLDMGVSYIMTNEPADLIAFLRTVEYRPDPAATNPTLQSFASRP
ncbi:glycerophosphodiester phosphodiesterase family protein [Sphingomonas albertensis]|uniref:Glycerophosphodiester phosphodiesterase family protein n=1 Tax=Sphingomonas albertensis TaxID=2762591 RepID=A0ABR7ALT8_9SPHN|nr:glycerophosphodiester phosphodiesterase family protein [Sphingomonas albertensis]MBC3941427.1 glycerophosphodiester phosphodiesterase family protein [Sphingomonas albertensis]